MGRADARPLESGDLNCILSWMLLWFAVGPDDLKGLFQPE